MRKTKTAAKGMMTRATSSEGFEGFLKARCVFSPSITTSLDRLYMDYQKWGADSKRYEVGYKDFERRLLATSGVRVASSTTPYDLLRTAVAKLEQASGASARWTDYADLTHTALLRCPAHNDRQSSLSVALGRDADAVLVKCHAGCKLEKILKTACMRAPDLFLDGHDGEPLRALNGIGLKSDPFAVSAAEADRKAQAFQKHEEEAQAARTAKYKVRLTGGITALAPLGQLCEEADLEEPKPLDAAEVRKVRAIVAEGQILAHVLIQYAWQLQDQLGRVDRPIVDRITDDLPALTARLSDAMDLAAEYVGA